MADTRTHEERLEKLEAAVEGLKPTLHERLERLEKTAKAPAPKGLKGFAVWMGPALPQLIGSAVILVLGLWVKDSVDLAIKQKTLQLSYAKEMKEQLDAMAANGADLGSVERAAVVVATYGTPAIMPLMNELRQGGNRALGAEAGLRSLAFMIPADVCDAVPRVAASPGRVLGVEGHMASARILAAGGCRSALPMLREHERLLQRARAQDPAGLRNLVIEEPSVVQQKAWLETLQEAIEALSARPEAAG
jgi:hypothetical protein